jgi:hypothetical protein
MAVGLGAALGVAVWGAQASRINAAKSSAMSENRGIIGSPPKAKVPLVHTMSGYVKWDSGDPQV